MPDVLPLAISCGDPSGIGPEIVAEAWQRRAKYGGAPFFLIGDPRLTADRAKRAGIEIRIVECGADDAIAHFHSALPVVALKNVVVDRAGTPEAKNASGIIEAIDRGVGYIRDGLASGLVTCPISKKPLYEAGFEYPGHTEYLGHLAQTDFGVAAQPVMMIAGPELRTVPVTIHIPLSAVPAALTMAAIVGAARIVDAALRASFAIAAPRLAIAGLNPHAGEGGALGREDAEIIAPAIELLRAEGIDARGPLPADTMFHKRARETYDAAICMYHDQALIPAKMLGFDHAVNVTLGLPFIRTSPDHGTAFDIAGKGIARPDSLIAAIDMAASMSRRSAHISA